jgi:hypothetical protein
MMRSTEWPAVVYAHNNPLSVLDILHQHARAERQRRMRERQRVGIHGLAVRRLGRIDVIPGGEAHLGRFGRQLRGRRVVTLGCWDGLRSWKWRA